jgi:hypothetical protein
MKPKRIQLRRTKGWRLPPNTVVVSRPSRWGNPVKIESWHLRDKVLAVYRRHVLACVDSNPGWLEPLHGKNLACWCHLKQSCHADVLLELANGVTARTNEPKLSAWLGDDN